MSEYVYSNVNEDGLVYNQTTSIVEAFNLLDEFPNDMLCVTVKGGWDVIKDTVGTGFSND